MKKTAGLDLLAEAPGAGAPAASGDRVTFRFRVVLNRGDEADAGTSQTRLGARHVVAGFEYALHGMAVGGYRRVRIAPHLAYRDAGVPGKIPPNAVLVVELWLDAIERAA